jgi:DNA-binding XRE family transcriptional regulator
VSRQEQGRPQINVFAAELAAARQHAGLTQDELGALIHYSASTIAMVEAGHRAPSLDFARALDRHFRTPVHAGKGTFERLYHVVRSMPLPVWFRPFAEVEAIATALRLWEHSVIPGLLQTEDYARAMLSVKPNTTQEDLDALVSARMARQSVLTREGGPPLVWALIDEAALLRCIGGRAVMRDQLLHLVKVSAEPAITLQVVPLETSAHPGLSGACAVADVDGAETAYLETVADGYTAEDATTVRNVSVTFDTLRAAALPARASAELITRRAEDYGPS